MSCDAAPAPVPAASGGASEDEDACCKVERDVEELARKGGLGNEDEPARGSFDDPVRSIDLEEWVNLVVRHGRGDRYAARRWRSAAARRRRSACRRWSSESRAHPSSGIRRDTVVDGKTTPARIADIATP